MYVQRLPSLGNRTKHNYKFMHASNRHYLERALSQIMDMVKSGEQEFATKNLSYFPNSRNPINFKKNIPELRKPDLELNPIQVP